MNDPIAHQPDAKPVAHKFGGSSLADAGRIAGVVDILEARGDPALVVVVSAMRGVTDALIELTQLAARGDAGWNASLEALRERHQSAARELVPGDAVLEADIGREFRNLADVLHALVLLGSPGEDALAWVSGLGEVLSSRLLQAAWSRRDPDVLRLDAREVLVVRHEALGAVVDWEASAQRLAEWCAGRVLRKLVITGFVARLRDGRATTLGRNGSDYSGSIFAALFEASELHIWTDVDGIYSADPRFVPEATRIASLSYDEACELAYFGAKVIHPQTLAPAMARGIPIRLRSTFSPTDPGSRIAEHSPDQPPVKGLSAVDGLALVTVEGAGMIGVPGTAERVFGALHRAGVSVSMISQGSSEHSICCVVRAEAADLAVAALQEAFAAELRRGQLQQVHAETGISVLAAVGEGMAGTPGVAARLFNALARARINVRAIAQGSSERNISVAVSQTEAARALRAAHAGFYLSPQTVSVGLIGPGQVGAVLLQQISEAAGRLTREAGLDVRLRGIAGSRRQVLSEAGLSHQDWQPAYADSVDSIDLDAFGAHIKAEPWPHAVIIDCTASDEVAERYPEWLAAGIHIITPNKRAGAGDAQRYAAIRQAQETSGARFRYEATVGAGLPVIGTLRDLLDTGDEVFEVDAVLSGTLAWLCNRFDGSRPFSELVLEAKALGYTEPDPRDDLSGMDVARKLVILSREMGMDVGLDSVTVESLVPDSLSQLSREGFLQRLTEIDAPMQERLAAAQAEGKVLRHVAHLDRDGGLRVGLAALPAEHAFAHLRLTDNVVQFRTRRYDANPLIVQGPGAGPEVTAAGVFSDLLRLAANLGARL